jgi:hypothetical protein
MTHPSIKRGIYRHFKGHEYRVIGISYQSETLEPMVVYESLYDADEFPKGTLWVRPYAMFIEEVNVNGTTHPRFTFIAK